jgi:hypothetical protein
MFSVMAGTQTSYIGYLSLTGSPLGIVPQPTGTLIKDDSGGYNCRRRQPRSDMRGFLGEQAISPVVLTSEHTAPKQRTRAKATQGVMGRN